MFVVGLVGSYSIFNQFDIPLNRLKTETYTLFSRNSLAVIPLFILMGQFAAVSGVSRRLFRAFEVWLGHRKGGVAMAAVGACAGFGSICGSSLATVATMGKTALPELRRQGYGGGLASATLAAGGTLGILIPPSIVLILFAIIAEQNITKLFIAAIIPGLLATLGYMLAIRLYVYFYPKESGYICNRESWYITLKATADTWPVALVFTVIIGGILAGLFSPNEGASIGVVAMVIITFFVGRLNFKTMQTVLLETGKLTALIYFILLGASFYNGFLALTQVPQSAALWISQLSVSPYIVLILILAFYFILGCMMDSLSMILLTTPLFFPIISMLDFGMPLEQTAIWFGILTLICVEVGLITPPIGLNLFVIHAMDKSVPLIHIYKAITFFVAFDMVKVALLVAFPMLTLILV